MTTKTNFCVLQPQALSSCAPDITWWTAGIHDTSGSVSNSWNYSLTVCPVERSSLFILFYCRLGEKIHFCIWDFILQNLVLIKAFLLPCTSDSISPFYFTYCVINIITKSLVTDYILLFNTISGTLQSPLKHRS